MNLKEQIEYFENCIEHCNMRLPILQEDDLSQLLKWLKDYNEILENGIWVLTGEDEWGDRITLGITKSLEDTQQAEDYYKSKGCSNIDYAPFTFKTYNTIPVMWGGNFNISLIPCAGIDTYLMTHLNYSCNKKYLDPNIDPKNYERFNYNFEKTVSSNGRCDCKVSGWFDSATEPPPSLPQKQLREWLRDKINEKGYIKVTLPDYDEFLSP